MPDPNECRNNEEAMILECANSAVEILIDDSPANSPCSTPRKRKRGNYNYLDDEQRAKIAKLAVENGVAKAAQTNDERSRPKCCKIYIKRY